MNHRGRHYLLSLSLIALGGLGLTVPSFASEPVLPAKSQAQTQTSQFVQPKIDQLIVEAVAVKRKTFAHEAIEVLAETRKALKALQGRNTDAALKALAQVTSKLDLIVMHDPKLAQTPVDTEVVTYDLMTDLEAIQKVITEAKIYMNDGEIQKARPLVANLASEIQFRTLHIPLETYSVAIKRVVSLVDAGKIEEAKAELLNALNNWGVTTDEVMPLTKVRAEFLLEEAQSLTEKKERSKEENDKLTNYLQAARKQLQIAELLGYGKKKDYRPMYEQIRVIETQSAGGKSGFGWFDKVREQLANVCEHVAMPLQSTAGLQQNDTMISTELSTHDADYASSDMTLIPNAFLFHGQSCRLISGTCIIQTPCL